MPPIRLKEQESFTLSESAADSTGLRERLKRAAYLRHLLEVYRSDDDNKPHDAPIWEAWLAQSGELPPDFDALPSNALLPNVLQFSDGSPVRTHEEWSRRREEVLDVLQHYQLGRWPQPPRTMLVEELASSPDDALGGELRKVLLTYGPDDKAVTAETLVPYRDPSMFRSVPLHVEVYVPPGSGPFPAVVEVGDRRGRRMMTSLSERAAQRGYVVCSFDRMDAFLARDVYPDCDCNQMVWWGYAASRCIDYLCGLDEVDPSKIAVMGHSRGGKMAMVAAVLDERIAATVASHPGAGSGQVAPWRYLGEKYGGETLESSTLSFPFWNHPRLRFFAGRENKLPFDSHFMMSLVAPRALLISQGDADDVGECWGAQQAYLATKEVYELLDHPGRLHIIYHGGGHRLSEDAQEAYIDWLDMQFGRRPLEVSEELMYTYTFDRWREVTGEEIRVGDFPERSLDDLLLCNDGTAIKTLDAWHEKRKSIQQRVRWGLGDLPLLRPIAIKGPSKFSHPSPGLLKADLVLEEAFTVHITYPEDSGDRLPAVIFLHAYVDALGCASTSEYGWSPPVGERLAQLGFLVAEYDQFGYGTRNHDAGIEFYAQRPTQSAMGVMVQDVRKVVNALSQLEMVDDDCVMAAGYSLGGTVALFAAALDERIKAVASTCGFSSMRLDSHGNETEGLRRYSHLRPLLPRLGFFLGNEKRVPFDFHEILALIAPRPLFVLAPLLDQDWIFEDVKACIEPAREVYRLLGAEKRLRVHTPLDFNRYPPAYQNRVNHWLWETAGCVDSPTN